MKYAVQREAVAALAQTGARDGELNAGGAFMNAAAGGRAAAAAATKARIERAAAALFAERGVDAATTRDIARACGVSEGALYRHFPSKAALAQALFEKPEAALARRIRAIAALPGGVDDKAAAIVDAYCRAAEEDWPLFSYYLQNAHRFAPRGSGRARRAADNPVDETEKLLRRAMDAGDLPKGNAALMAAMALGAVLQAARHKLDGRLSESLSDLAGALKKSVSAILRS